MNRGTLPVHPLVAGLPELVRRADAVGLGVLRCDERGRLHPRAGTVSPLLRRLLARPDLVRAALGANGDETPPRFDEPIALGPGLRLLPRPLFERRRCLGALLAVAVTPEANDPHRHGRLARRLGLAPGRLPELLRDVPVVPADELEVRFGLFRDWCSDLEALDRRTAELTNLGEHLCETYEELNLLYRLGDNMGVGRQPEDFIRSLCRELRRVLPFQWIAVKLLRWPHVETSINGLFVMEGRAEPSHEELSRRAEELLAVAEFEGGALVLRDRDEEARRPDMPEMPDEPDEDLVFDLDDETLLEEPAVEDATTPLPRLARCPIGPMFGENMIIAPLFQKRSLVGALFAVNTVGDDVLMRSSNIKMIEVAATHLRIFLENSMLYEQMQRMFLGTLESLTAAIDAKDEYTCGHSRRVALLSRMLARAAGLEEHVVERVHIAGLVHDVGKIGVPESVLRKEGSLTDPEFAAIRRHPAIGARILRDIPNFEDIIPGVLYHHEHFDGRGYPFGLRGRNIPLFGRIIAIADAFDAMSSTRTYRNAKSRRDVRAEIARCAGTQFDPDLTGPFLSLDLAPYDEASAEDARRHDRPADAA